MWAAAERIDLMPNESADQILEALDPDQRDVALALHGPVCVLAGAGTGKTRAITHRIAYGVRTGVYTPTSVLAVTFTARAAGEMRTRLRELGATGVQARTFHAAALRQLSYFWPKVVGGAPPRILEHKAAVVGESARRLGLGVDRDRGPRPVVEVEWAKVSLVTADDYVKACAAIDRPAPAGYDPQTVARLIAAYEEVKTERSVIDFEDVLLMLGDMLSSQGAMADEVRRAVPPLRRRRVPGRLPAPAVPAGPVARRTQGAVRRGRPVADHLLVHGRHAPPPPHVPRPGIPVRRWSGSSGTTGPRPRS